ncbi:hypothetical protein HGRIS_010412 [Hohenbuehelia grisea]|uniref:Secreted protein n=1 Tax=Hohenbuehelia grisea TaxID=104357 RepID=A0ABR3J496_9AGAR
MLNLRLILSIDIICIFFCLSSPLDLYTLSLYTASAARPHQPLAFKVHREFSPSSARIASSPLDLTRRNARTVTNPCDASSSSPLISLARRPSAALDRSPARSLWMAKTLVDNSQRGDVLDESRTRALPVA